MKRAALWAGGGVVILLAGLGVAGFFLVSPKTPAPHGNLIPKSPPVSLQVPTPPAGDLTPPAGGERDLVWSGGIHLTESVVVPEGRTLTIQPGTVVRFAASRDYKRPNKLSLEVHGKLTAVGTPQQPIRFTSDAPQPQNGDWAMIRLLGKTRSEIRYAIVEFAQQGINMWQSDATIAHSIVRWNNWEGIYAESYSLPTIESNRVYQNGYNGMAMEQFNTATLRNNIFSKNGTHGVHVDASTAYVENNVFHRNGAAGLSVDNASTVTATSNTLEANAIAPFMCGEGRNVITGRGNKRIPETIPDQCSPAVFAENTKGVGAARITFSLADDRTADLGYTPGDRLKDRYQYVYLDDETRRIVKKIGKGLGLTWSLAFDGKTLWTSTLSGDISQLDPVSGMVLKTFKAPSSQPWGMAHDGQNLWITDFAEKRTYALDPATGKEVSSFPNPDQERGAKGLAWDGQFLYVMGWTTNTIYKLDRQGHLLGTVELEGGAGGGLTWDGARFWAPCATNICAFTPAGKRVGEIYPASEGTWDLAWEPANNPRGGYLWATQRTNENWHDDEKIFRLEILDDSLKTATQG